MKIINDNDIEELPLPSFDIDGHIQVPKSLGRGKGRQNLTLVEKEIITIHANADNGTQASIAEAAGVSGAEVSILERGIDRTNIDGRKENEHLKTLGLQTKHKIIDAATTKVMDLFDIFDPNALEQKEIPGAVAKIATVVDKFTGDRGPVNNIQFVIYQPRQKSEEDFGEVIELNEK